MALNYLLDPAFEMVNTAGKPATGGKINVFVHGTRDKYYCASDFNGTLLPFDIPLDSLGSAVILADDSQAYDVYIYNRYGTLMMSRYNVQPKSGGGVSVQSITSTDGTITVTDTAGGVDLSVNGAIPSVLRASGDILTSDGSFTCTPLKQSGSGVIVDQNGKVKVEHGWYHYDIVTHFDYSGTPTNQTVVVALKHGGLESCKEVDLSYPNEGTIALSAETYNPASGLEEFNISVSGIPDGMSIELVELGIHSIAGHGGGVTYTAGSGIEIIDDEISVDTTVVATQTDLESKQDTLTAGDNISIVDNVISATAAPQVNADWDASSGVSEILNKPDLSIYAESSDLATVATTGSYDDLLDKPTIPPAQVNADWDATSGIQEILNKPTLAAVATSGAYADLSGTPTLATVATSGSYDDLLDKPSIPPAQINADWASSSGVSEILHKPTEKGLVAGSNITITESNDTVTISAAASEQVNSDWDSTSGVSEILNKPDLSIYAETSNLATVATTGDYDDLVNKPTIPAAQVNSDWDSSSGVSQILNKPNLSTVATTGDYDDLVNKPSIPAAQVNADWASTSGVSEILNKPSLAAVATSGDYSDLSNTPTIPTATSDLTNDSGFITLSDVPAQVNADWNSSSGASEILNKPTIPSGTQLVPAATSADVDKVLTVNAQGTPAWATAQAPISAGDGIDVTNNVVSAKVDGTTIDTNASGELTVIGGGGSQVNSDWDATSGVAEILNKPNLATVATTGDYSDLQNLPSIPAAQVNSDWNATSGVAQIFNKPSIPTATSDLTNDSNFITLSDVPAQVNADWNAASGVSEILHKPTIPSGAQLVPAATSADVNKVLTVNAQGTPAWANSSGGNEVYVTWDDTSAGWSSMWTQVQTALSQNKEVYIKDGFCVAEVIGVYDGQVNFRGLSNSNFGSPPKITYNYYTLQTSFAYKETRAQYVLPNPSSGSIGQVLGLVSSDDPPYSEPAWVNSSGGGGTQVNSDWDATSGVAEILNKPTPKTLTAGANISISEGVGTLTISAAAGLPASTSADEGKCLVVDSNGDPEWGTGGKTYTGTDGVVVDNVNDTVGLEAPVDLVGGPGITVDNPDGNTVRISVNQPARETVLYYSDADSPGDSQRTYTLSETPMNFERIGIFMFRPVTGNWMGYTEFDTAYMQAVNKNSLTVPMAFIQNTDHFLGVYGVSGILTSSWADAQGGQMIIGSAYSKGYFAHIYKIIGINRIANN